MGLVDMGRVPDQRCRAAGRGLEVVRALRQDGIHSESGSCECALEECRGLERQPVAGEAAHDLHPQRQARRIKEAGDVDAGCTQKCPEPIEGRLSGRAQPMRRSAWS